MKFKLIIAAGILLTACNSEEKRLPILGEREPVTRTVDGKTVTDTLYQTIPAFAFLKSGQCYVH